MGLLKKLYAGVAGAALCSMLVGAIHFASYETVHRSMIERMASSSSKVAMEPAVSSQDRQMANVVAAVMAAFITAVVESPVELFRHNQQAGTTKGNFLREMVTVVRRDGPVGLYWGFLPHCFEAWPHDISELLVYGGMTDLREESLADPEGTAIRAQVSRVPTHVWDLATGAAAGAAAVLVSMPLDSVKTYLQTHGADLGASKGLISSARLFMETGAQMVAKGGTGSLFYGLTPRLLQQVPSSMICWYTIHQVQRILRAAPVDQKGSS